jgi:hypothetical protein
VVTGRRIVLVSLFAVVLAVVGLAAWAVLSVDDPGPASVGDALDRLQEEGGDDGGDRVLRPPEGVYVYEGEGREELSFPPLSQRDGDTMPATVTHEPDGCWTFRLDFNASHWQSWTYCRTDEGVVEVGGANGQAWDIGVSTVSNESTFTCDPPSPVLVGLEPGDSVRQSCRGTNTAIEGETVSAGRFTFVGPDTLDVGGEEVAVLHFRNRRRLSGSQDGPERTEVWFREDGLLVRYERDIEVRTASPIGDIAYTESGFLQLTDTEPRR